MKKVALTVAVLALGLAACAKNTTDNNAATDTNVENAAAVDTSTRPSPTTPRRTSTRLSTT